MRLYIARENEILSGEATDIYFKRTVDVIKKSNKDKRVRMEFHAYSLPYDWAVFAGLEEALTILGGKNVDVYAVPEGTIFRPKQPLMVIEGDYTEFGELETAILGVLRHSTSIATKAARIKLAAGNKSVLFFGLRALHPAIQPMADRAAYIGGVDGVAGNLSEKYLGIKPVGTMPHALMLVFGDPEEAWKAFDEYVEEEVPRIVLVDTFCDERMEALKAAKLLREKLRGVRLDTPGSRRGNMRAIVEEVRWTLDLHGFKNVQIIVSGGLNEEKIRELRDLVDAFGVGTSIAFPKSVDISADIVEVYENGKWTPRSKRGKWPGFKQLYRCNVNEDYVVPWNDEPPKCRDGTKPKAMLRKVMENGRLLIEPPSIEEIRKYVLEQLNEIEDKV
ncbi:nicotinate phosphoribosyltransferase [Ignicoccus pacificus DSM 13166]|uniref:nicotinate phosphoribosyltransferase n=1 Tax=Ignicoccus pacificus DSM 13166 TaxID=940294 RepID=A0A977KBB0_9CREN|nr:nicotinate phosphoribosyltransferase [Ignicoccus pacificus DSM 13166]